MIILLLLLSILKIVGLILLFIIVVFIVLLAIILFVPIKYNLEAEKSDKLYFDIEVNWLFKVVYFRYRLSYKSKKVIFKIFWKTLYKNKETFEKVENEIEYQKVKPEPTVERHDRIRKEKSKPTVESNDTIKKSNNKKTESSEDNTYEKIEKIPTTKRQKEKKIDKVIEKVVEEKIEDIEEVFEESVEEHPIWYRIKNFWDYPDRPKIIKSSLRLIKKLVKVLIPDKLSLDIEYGSDNPAHTGFALAFSSILVLYFGDNVKVRGNFQEKKLSGKVKGYGKVFLIDIVRPLLVFVFSWPIIKIIWKRIKKRKEE